MNRLRQLLKTLGPGLVTGASDDDPSGIATYSQAGAQFGLKTLWLSLLTFPLMAAVQEMCARVGAVTTTGLACTLRERYPKWILWVVLLTAFPATILNIGADIAGMGAVANLIIPPIPSYIFCPLFTVIIAICVVKLSYDRFAAILKWFCLVLFVYLVVPFMVRTDWRAAGMAVITPSISWNKEFINIVVAILGTTISPYLFFWQATMQAEGITQQKRKVVVNKRVLSAIRVDVNVGMFFSNLVMLFIILTCGIVLYPHGVHQIDTVSQAANALKPIAGQGAYALFAIGVIGTGFLAIPVLSGCISYMFAETFRWKKGLNKTFFQATEFYVIMILSLVVGLLINYLGISPMKSLLYTSILYGLTAPIIIAIILHICNKSIMKDKVNGLRSNVLGFLTLVVMTAAAVALIYLQF